MSREVLSLVLIGLQLATALGIVVFWIRWFRAEHDESAWPPGYRRHEQAFVVPDGMLAILLVASSLASLGNMALGSPLALVAAGVMLFLALFDLAYFAQQGMFAVARGGVGNAILVGWLLVLSAPIVPPTGNRFRCLQEPGTPPVQRPVWRPNPDAA